MNVVGQQKYGDLSRFSMMPNSPGVATGNPMLDSVISILLSGKNFIPPPQPGMGVYDSMLLKERSNNYLQGMRSSVAGSLLVQKMGGLNSNSAVGQLLTTLGAQPAGLMDSSLLRSLNGGNPVQSMMKLNSGMTGNTMAMAFGQNVNANQFQVQEAFDGLRRKFYEQRTVQRSEYDSVQERAGKEFGKQFGSAAERSFFKDSIVTQKDGTKALDFEKFKQNADIYAKKAVDSADKAVIDAYKAAVNQSNGLQDLEKTVGTSVDKRVNAKNTMGFETDDLTSAFLSAMDAGMLYDPNQRFVKNPKLKKGNIGDLASHFGENGASVLSAVSDLTGATTGQGAFGELNDLIGNSNVNLFNKDESKKMEDLLRRFKGTARAAGVSIEAVNEILSITKQITANNQSMEFAGGISSIETSLKAVTASSALIANMGPDWARANGGAGNVQQQVAATLAENKDEPIVKQLKAYASLINASPTLSAADKKQAIGRLTAAASNPESMSLGGAMGIRADVARTLGISDNQVLAYGNSMLGQQAGAEFDAEESWKGNDLGLDNAAGAGLMNNWRALAINGAIKGWDVKNKDGSVMSVSERIAAVEEAVGNGERIEVALQRYGIRSNGIDAMFTGPGGKRNRKNFELQTAQGTESFKQQTAILNANGIDYQQQAGHYAKAAAKLKSPFFTNLAQEFLSGDMSKGLAGISDAFLSPASTERGTSMMKALNLFTRNDSSPEAFENAFMEINGGSSKLGDSDVLKNLGLSGITGTEANDILAKRKAFTKDGSAALREVGKTLTMRQIMDAGNPDADWDNTDAAAKHLDREKVKQAAAFLTGTGLGSDKNLEKFGGEQLTGDTYRKMLLGPGVSSISQLAAREAIKGIETESDDSYEALMADQTYTGRDEQMQALDFFGLARKDETGNVTDIDTAGAMRLMNETPVIGTGADGKQLVGDDIRAALANDTLASDAKERLIKAKIATAGDDGKLTLNDEALDAQVGKELFVNTFRKNTALTQGAGGIQEVVDAAKKEGKDSDKLDPQIFNQILSALGSDSILVGTLNKLNTTLSAFNSN